MTDGDRRRLTLGRVAGVPVHISPTWFIVAAVITIGFAPLVRRQLPDLGGGTYAVTFVLPPGLPVLLALVGLLAAWRLPVPTGRKA